MICGSKWGKTARPGPEKARAPTRSSSLTFKRRTNLTNPLHMAQVMIYADQIDHDPDDLVPRPPLREVVPDLSGMVKDPTPRGHTCEVIMQILCGPHPAT